MHHSRLSTFVIDCRTENADEAARFWSAALGRRIEGADGEYRQLAGSAEEPILLVQKVDHPSRIHLDIETDDQEAEVKRLEATGARRVGDGTTPSATAVRLTAGKDGKAHDEHDLDFSPDGRSLAFLSDAVQPHQLQLYVADLGSGTVRQLTQVSGHLSRPRFRPDGREIAVLFIEGGADQQGPLKPAARRTGVVDELVQRQQLVLVS